MEVGLEEARRYFAAVGVDAPPVPGALGARVHRVRDGVWGTRDDVTGLYPISSFFEEAVTTDVGDYVLLGEGGHGAASQALHYYLVWRHLALFVQISWGHVYGDREAEREHATSVLAAVGRLIEAAHAAADSFRDGERLVVLQSDLQDNGLWRRVDGVLTLDQLAESDWATMPDAVSAAAAALTAD